MKIVIDTNVFISGIFFRGNPRTIIESIVGGRFDAYVTSEILEEYLEIMTPILPIFTSGNRGNPFLRS